MTSQARHADAISRMLAAKSVAIVGASDDERKVGYRPVDFLVRFGYQGDIYPVNRRLERCRGLRCYPSLMALPCVPDLVVVVVGARHVAEVLTEAASLGVPAAVLLTAGFAELGPEGRTLQDEITKIAASSGMLLVGPNSVGVAHAPNALTATFTEALTRGELPPGRTAIVSQSGAYGTVMLAEARERSVGVRTYISTGNEAVVGFGDFLGALVEDPEVRVVGGYVEEIRHAGSFRDAALRARKLGKPVVLIKAGRSDHGKRAAASHTGALAGRDEAYEAAFRRFGVVRADDDEELLDTLDAFNVLSRVPRGDRVAVVSTSGGAGVIMSDLIASSGLRMAAFSDELRGRLAAILPAFAAVGNPVDLTGQFVLDATGINDVLNIVAHDDDVDLVIVYGGLGWSTEAQLIEAVREAAETGAPVIAVCPLMNAGTRQRFRAAHVPAFTSAASAVRAGKLLVRWAANARSESAADSFPDLPMQGGLADELMQHSGVVSETRAKEMLQAIGLTIPRGGFARTRPEAERLGRELGGDVVLKAEVPGLVHKSDVGGVELGVPAEDAGAAFDRVIARVTAQLPGKQVTGVRIEELVRDGIECLVGAVQSEPFGLLLGVGRGGTTAEVAADVAFDLVPVSLERARVLVRSLRFAPLLEGYRSPTGFDIDALVRAVSLVSSFAARLGPRLQALDLNPLLVRPEGKGIVVLDAAIVLDEPEPRPCAGGSRLEHPSGAPGAAL